MLKSAFETSQTEPETQTETKTKPKTQTTTQPPKPKKFFTKLDKTTSPKKGKI